MLKKLKPYHYLIFIFVLVIFLRLPSLFEPNRYADEDIYLTIGQALRRGLVLYRDIHDNKPPFLYFVAAITQSVAGFRFILLLWHLVNVFFVWKIASLIFNKNLPVIIGTLLFAFYSSIPLTEGNIANGEIFMIMPATVAVYLLLRSRPNYLLAGLLFSTAFLFKVPIIFDYFAIIFWFVFFQSKNFKQIISRLFSLPLITLIVSFFTPIIISIIYYARLGAGQAYVRAALLQNLGYLSSWEGSRTSFFTSELFYRFLILIILCIISFLFRRHLGRHLGLLFIWFAGSLFGALLSGRPYPHYLIEIIAPLSLLAVYLFNSNRFEKVFILLSFLLTITSLVHYRFWHYQSISYYFHSYRHLLRLETDLDYYRYFGDNIVTDYQIAAYLQNYTTPQDRIFVWGTEPSIYSLSRRLPVGKYTVAYHIADFDAFSSTIDALKIYYPPYIVYFSQNPPFPQLDEFIDLYYHPVKTYSNAVVYSRLQ